MTNIKIISTVIWLLLSSLGYAYNPGLKYNGADAEADKTGCVYLESDGDWIIGECDYKGAHNACYNGSNWKVAQAIGTVDEPGEPVDGDESNSLKTIDSWNPDRADARCKDLFGPSYFFSVPTSVEEDEALDIVLRDELYVQIRRTWLYYYSNDLEVPQSADFWFGNRTAYSKSLIADNKDESFSNADCTVLNRDTGYWEDVNCNSDYAFACFESGEWLVTSEVGKWRNGYAKCDKDSGVQSLYAVPRNELENLALQAKLQNVYDDAGSSDKASYNKVWLNYSDLVFEEFFVANQRRQAWWAESQPTNRRNADCTLIDHLGNWTSESCDKFEAYHACKLGQEGQWALTNSIPDLKGKTTWAYGFGYCKRLQNANFAPPKTSVSNLALAGMLAEGEFAWVNYSDQDNEGAWKEESQYQDFDAIDSVIEGDGKDCGLYSNKTNSKNNWQSAKCFAGGVDREFACTNGYEWQVTSLKDDLWKRGFEQCKAAFGEDYYFAAPSTADQNSRLGVALSLSGLTEIWINLNDTEQEGVWVANGPIVNLSPVVTLLSGLEFNEKNVMPLSVSALDPEDEGTLFYSWEIVEIRIGGEGLDSIVEPNLLSANSETMTIEAVDLLNDPYYIDLKLQVTDSALEPSTTTLFYTVTVLPPLKAAYAFDSYTNPGKDLTGNGHDIALSQDSFEIAPHLNSFTDRFVKLDASEVFTIVGTGEDGLIVGELTPDEVLQGKISSYTVIYRFKLDEEPSGSWAGLMQKGSGSTRQPGVFYQKSTQKIQAANTTTTSFNESIMSNELVRLGQWMTVAYVKEGEKVYLYIDKAEAKIDDPADVQGIPDATLILVGESNDFATGDWSFGNVPGAGEGINGGFDDIRIYDRALLPTELASIFRSQPSGRFEFTVELAEGNEEEVDAAVNDMSVSVERVEGDNEVVEVGYKLVSGTAVLNTDFKLKGDVSGSGQGTLQWGVHDRLPKNIDIELIGDSLREGTESFSLELEQLETEPGLADKSTMTVNIVDKTPNPYGAFAISASNAPIKEGDSGSVMVERSGTDTLNDYKVLYAVHETSANSPADFSITATDADVSFVLENNPATSLVGTGEITFFGNLTGTPVISDIKGISFSSVSEDGLENNEFFTVGLLDIQDLAGTSVIGSSTDAILGTNLSYQQLLTDVTPGRVSFSAENYTSVDEADGTSSVSIELQRLDGDDGKLCIDLKFDAGDANHIDDFTINYGGASAGSGTTGVIFWDDQDAVSKTIILTAVDDNVFEPEEIVQLGFIENLSCGENIPDTAIPGDFMSASVNIQDVTDAAELSFSAPVYSQGELDGNVLITVNNSGNINNAFKVYLTRSENTAKPGQDYAAISDAEAIVSFAAGEASKSFSLNIFDNCVNTAELSFTVGLSNNHVELDGQNTLPISKIVTGGNVATVKILNGFPAVAVSTALDLEGLSNPAPNSGGRYRVTNSSFDAAQIKFKATNNTADSCFLNYQWSDNGTTPALPSGGVLPSNFSSNLTIGGTSDSSDPISLPFLVDDTVIRANVVVTHPEAGAVTIAASVNVGAYWRRIRNDGDNNDCVRIDDGNTTVRQGGTCNSVVERNFTYNKATKQVVGQKKVSGEINCWKRGGNVEYRACDANSNQEFTYGTSGACGSDIEFMSGGETVVEPVGSNLNITGSPGWSTCGARNWDWTGAP
jgi:hypothetical protein